MIDFSTVTNIKIPEGNVIKITKGTDLLWELPSNDPAGGIVWSVGVRLNKTTGAEETNAYYSASQLIYYDPNDTYNILIADPSVVSICVCWYDDNYYCGYNGSTSITEDYGDEGLSVNLVPMNSATKFRIRAYTIFNTDPDRTNALKEISVVGQ